MKLLWKVEPLGIESANLKMDLKENIYCSDLAGSILIVDYARNKETN